MSRFFLCEIEIKIKDPEWPDKRLGFKEEVREACGDALAEEIGRAFELEDSYSEESDFFGKAEFSLCGGESEKGAHDRMSGALKAAVPKASLASKWMCWDFHSWDAELEDEDFNPENRSE